MRSHFTINHFVLKGNYGVYRCQFYCTLCGE